ncbi:MAG: hypothetical protein ACRDOY_09430 [Nocardioidaceae bacterium]
MNTLLKGLIGLVAGVFGFGLVALGVQAASADDDLYGKRDDSAQEVALVTDRDDDNGPDDRNDVSRNDHSRDDRNDRHGPDDRNDVSRNDHSRDG